MDKQHLMQELKDHWTGDSWVAQAFDFYLSDRLSVSEYCFIPEIEGREHEPHKRADTLVTLSDRTISVCRLISDVEEIIDSPRGHAVNRQTCIETIIPLSHVRGVSVSRESVGKFRGSTPAKALIAYRASITYESTVGELGGELILAPDELSLGLPKEDVIAQIEKFISALEAAL
jgi:hypothetical protein